MFGTNLIYENSIELVPRLCIRTADDKDASNKVAIPDRYCSASSTDLASSKSSGTVPCSVSTEETDKVHRKRRRLSSHTDSIWYNGSHPSKNNQLQTESHRTNPTRQSPAPLTTQRELSSPQNVIDTYFHSCEPQLDNIHFGGIASDHERSIFNPMSSDAVFSLFSDHQVDNVQLDSTPADEGRTIFNPMSSEAVFSLSSDHQLNNVQLDNIQPDNLQLNHVQLDSTTADQRRTIFNPMSSNAGFSLFSDRHLDGAQLNRVAETDQGNICDRQAPSHSFCSPFSNSPLYHTTAKIGFNSTEFNRARSEVL